MIFQIQEGVICLHFVDAKNILSAKNGMNIYRGCTHGCIYCDSRSDCYQFHHEFDDIVVKQNAPVLLEQALKSKRKKCMIATGAMCDPYMHCEEKLKLTRQCLELIDRYEFGAAILTKSDLILRDLDLLTSINRKSKCVVQMTLTTYDENLCKIVEPHVCTTKKRFETLKILQEHNIPTIVWLSPILPFINDSFENIKGILQYCVEAKVKGVLCFGMGLTLRDGNREYFYSNLNKSFPGLRRKYYETYGYQYEVSSPRETQLKKYFVKQCKEQNFMYEIDEIFAYLNKYPENQHYQQMSLFH